MAEKLGEFPPAGNRRKYPWEDWLNGEIWMLRRGTDFDADVQIWSVRSAATMYAHRHGLRIRTSIWDNDTLIVEKLG